MKYAVTYEVHLQTMEGAPDVVTVQGVCEVRHGTNYEGVRFLDHDETILFFVSNSFLMFYVKK